MDWTYYTYRITAPGSKYYYYGVSHVKTPNATKHECLHDGYYGSGGGSAENKYRRWKRSHRDTMQKTVISLFDTKLAAYEHEQELVGERWRDDPYCLNSMPGGVYTGEFYVGPTIALAECAIHGVVKHSGGACATCKAHAGVNIRDCTIHGVTKHTGDLCYQCMNHDKIVQKECTVHGWTKHIGETCYSCRGTKYTLRHCATHGETWYDGETCAKCRSSDAVVLQHCERHGEVAHSWGYCTVCKTEQTVHTRECPHHGWTTHQGQHCRQCVARKTVMVKDCPRHGMKKHQGDQCNTCLAYAVAHKRAHGEQTNMNCWVCQDEITTGVRATVEPTP